MHCGMWEGALARLGVEILDQGTKRIQLQTRRVPSHQHLPPLRPQHEREHGFLVIHIHLHLLRRLRVRHGVAIPYLDLRPILTSRTQQSTDNAVLVSRAAGGVVEDAEEGLRVDSYGDGRGGGRLRADCGGCEGAREVQVVG